MLKSNRPHPLDLIGFLVQFVFMATAVGFALYWLISAAFGARII